MKISIVWNGRGEIRGSNRKEYREGIKREIREIKGEIRGT